MSTAPDLKSAQKIARGLVEKKLAACVSILPEIQSVYRWKKKLETSREVMLFIKTSGRRAKALESYFKKRHPYDLPEFLVLPVTGGSREYLSWLDKAV